VNGMLFNPWPVTGGQSDIVSVTLDAAAPSGGLVVSLASDNPVVTVPATVTVPAGATSKSFTVTTSKVTSVTDADIYATTTVGGTWVWENFLEVDPVCVCHSASQRHVFFGISDYRGRQRECRADTQRRSAGRRPCNCAQQREFDRDVPVSVYRSRRRDQRHLYGRDKGRHGYRKRAVEPRRLPTREHGIGFNTLEVVPAGYVVPRVTSMSFNPSPATAGGSTTVTLGLSTAAPSGGLVIGITSSSSAVAVPATVTAAARRDQCFVCRQAKQRHYERYERDYYRDDQRRRHVGVSQRSFWSIPRAM